MTPPEVDVKVYGAWPWTLMIVSDRNEVLISSGLRDKIRIVAPPTDAP